MRWMIVDLDNCISDDGWRIPFIDWNEGDLNRRYHPYHAMCGADDWANLDLIENTCKKVVLTARPLIYRGETVNWMRAAGVEWDHLLMRNVHDHRPSVELKRAQVHCLLQHYNLQQRDCVLAIDDRQDVLDMYWSVFGLRTKLVRIHGLCAYTPPAGVENAANRV